MDAVFANGRRKPPPPPMATIGPPWQTAGVTRAAVLLPRPCQADLPFASGRALLGLPINLCRGDESLIRLCVLVINCVHFLWLLTQRSYTLGGSLVR